MEQQIKAFCPNKSADKPCAGKHPEKCPHRIFILTDEIPPGLFEKMREYGIPFEKFMGGFPNAATADCVMWFIDNILKK